MKIAAREAAGFLREPDKSCRAVLLYGPDSGLARERGRAIAATLLGKESDPMNLVQLTAEQLKSDPARLRDELCALSLLGGRRVVTLSGATDKLTGTVESALEGPDGAAYLIVEADELASSSSLRQLFEKRDGLAAFACYRDEGRNLEDTVRAALAQHGMRATADAMRYLVAHLGNDRGVTLGEIEKIALYAGADKEVTLDTAMKLVGQNGAESMEDICHAVACGNLNETQALLGRLLHEGAQPVAIVRALLRHFQRLDLAAAHIAAGKPVESALAALRPPVFFKYVPSTRRALSLFKPRSLAQALTLLLKTEKELKSSGSVSPALITGHALSQLARMAAA